jgi:hypothetical protein
VPDEKGETRRDRNDRFGEPSPVLTVSPASRYIWDWYFDLSSRVRRVRDGVCEPIPPSEFVAWREATRHIVYPSEYAILGVMDGAYCAEMNKELFDYRARERERAAAEAEKNRPKRGRGR